MGKHVMTKRKGLAAGLISALLFGGLAMDVSISATSTPAHASTCADLTVTPLHGNKIYFNSKPNPDFNGHYLGYRVTAASSNHTAVTVSVTLNTPSDASLKLRESSGNNAYVTTAHRSAGNLTAGGTVAAYFFSEVQVGPNDDAIMTPTIQVRTSTLTCNFTPGEQIERIGKSVLKANANKIYSATVSATGVVGKGSRVIVTVTGNTGTVGSGPYGQRDIQLVPVSVVDNWAPEAWELEKVAFKSGNPACNAGSPIVNRLYLSNATSPKSTDCAGVYSAFYTFKARETFSGSQANSSQVQAFSYIASGNLIKHTAPFGTVIGLPRADANSSNIVTASEPDLNSVLLNAPIPFTVNDLSMQTDATTQVLSSEISYFNSTNGINWNSLCIGATISELAPTAACGTSNITIASSTAQTGGIFSIVSMSDGTKRIRYNPNNAPRVTSETVEPAEVGFRLTDGSGNVAYGLASGEVTNLLLARNLEVTTFQGQATESAQIASSNVALESSRTCILSGSSCVSLSAVTVPGVGSWQMSSSNTRITFTPVSNFSGSASIDFRIQSSGGTPQTAFGSITANVIGAPSVTPRSASTSQMTVVTLSPAITAQGEVTRCIYLSEPAPNPCTSSSTGSASISWTLLANGVVSFSSAAGYSGTTSVIYGVTDSYGQFASASMTVQVIPPAPPTISSVNAASTTAAVVTLSPVLTASSSFTVCIENSGTCVSSLVTANGAWTVVGNQIRFQSSNGFTGSTNITARITDSSGQTATASQTVSVSAPPAPTVQNASGTTITTTPKTLTPSVNSALPTVGCIEDSANPGTCLAGLLNVSGVGSWSTSSGTVTFTADPGFTGSATVSYLVTDTLGQTSSAVLTVIVQPSGTPQLAAVTLPATSVATTSATLNGSVNASGASSTVYFCYGTNPTLSNCTLAAATPTSVAGGGSASVSMALSGLTAGTEYFFRVVASDATSTESGVILSFSTPVVAQQNTPPAPAPQAPQDSNPCVQTLAVAQTDQDLIVYFAETFEVLLTGAAGSVAFGLDSLAANDLAVGWTAAQILSNNSLLASFGVLQSSGEAMLDIAWHSRVAKQTALEPSDIVLSPGAQVGEVEVKTTDGQPLELLSVQSIDLNLYVSYTGAQLNNPLLWQNMGYGLLCWKLEPFTETVFTLPNPIDLPAGTPAGNWVYSNVIVKAGSLTADPTTFQANTLFPKPGPGNAVWADVNGNGIYDPGGKNGDKAISHIVICADLLSQTTAPTPTPTQSTPTQSAPTEQPTSPAPSPTGTAPVPATPAPPLTPTPSGSPTPTQSIQVCASPIPTNTTDKPRIADPTPTPTQSQGITIGIVPLNQPTPSPTPTQPGSTPSPSPTAPGATPTPTPTAPGTTPTPTPTAPGTTEPTQSPTPEVPGTPGGGTIPEPTIDLSSPSICEPNEVFSVALKVTNGLSTTCLRVTSVFFSSIAFAPRENLEQNDVASPQEPGDEVLADTGANTSDLLLWALMLFGAGLGFTFLARRRV